MPHTTMSVQVDGHVQGHACVCNRAPAGKMHVRERYHATNINAKRRENIEDIEQGTARVRIDTVPKE